MPAIAGIFKGFQAINVIATILFTLAVAAIIIAVLPVSPFQTVISTLDETPYIGWLNWFFPVGKCLTVMVSWCAAIAIFYGVSWILRQLHIIGS